MSKPKPTATRESFGRALEEIGRSAEDLVVLDADLADATKTCYFRDAFPDRFVECGIAEANMIDVAAGLSTTGHVPFASTFAMFAAGRAYEQIRNTIGYPHLNVKIGATHGGITVGEDGASHQCLEDIALMRTIPGMTVLCPADDPETRAMVRTAYETDGPFYIRLSRSAVPVIHDPGYEFCLGKGEVLREGKDIAIVSTGILTAEALEAARLLEETGIDAMVIHIGTIKPVDRDLLQQAASQVKAIVTVEEHNTVGGLADAVSMAIEDDPVPMLRLGVNDAYGQSGPARDLLKEFGLDADGLSRQIRGWINRHEKTSKDAEHTEKTR